MTRDEVRQLLAAPFDPTDIDWRIGATNSEKTRGLALAYLDARAVMNRLDDVLGVFGWQSKHAVVGDRTICQLSIRDPETGEWVSRTDGAGDTDVEAEKGAFSSSLKRCAVNFGIGRYLYDVASPWVELEQKGKSQVIPERELARLRSGLAGKAQSNAAGENGSGAQARNAPAAAAGIPSAAATPKARHPKWDYAGARFREIENALKGAGTETNVHDIWEDENNEEDIALIKKLHPPAHKTLIALRDEMLTKLRQSSHSVLDAMRTGSAPGLMGEP